MSGSLFVTGATGLVGRHLLETLDFRAFEQIYCLTRRPSSQPPMAKAAQHRVEIIGDLTDPSSYAHVLPECSTVIHLAAATGKQPLARYHEVNVVGTRELISQCERANVKNFLNVSSIAAKSARDHRYAYASSKRLAEEVVQASTLNYTIVRPTIVLAKDSPIWTALSRLARLPRPVIFGSGTARIQPIYIADLSACLNDILMNSMFDMKVYEIGGPDILSFGKFIEEIHKAYCQRYDQSLTIPITPLIRILSILEHQFSAILPISSGQLTAFISDGTIDDNDLFRRHVADMQSVNGALQMLLTDDHELRTQ